MKSKFLISVSVLIVLLFSCKKEEPEDIIPETTEDFIIKDYNEILSIDGEEYYDFDLDVNNDNTDDYKFRMTFRSTDSRNPKIELCCLHSESMLKGYYVTDTLFRHWENSGYGYFVTCYRATENDHILSVRHDNFIPDLQLAQKEFDPDEYFVTDTVTLIGDNYKILSRETYEVFIDSCNDIATNNIYFINTKLSTLDTAKYGWLKFELTDNYDLVILQSVCQK